MSNIADEKQRSAADIEPTAPLQVNVLEVDSPIGPLLLASADGKLISLSFGPLAEAGGELLHWLGRQGLGEAALAPNADAVLEAASEQLAQYFTGMRVQFELPVQLYGSPFQRKVWQALMEIPYGQTVSYKDVALSIEQPKAVRAVGGANNRNPLPIIYPCHRVIGKGGSLVGYGGGLPIKQFLLNLEMQQTIEAGFIF